MSRKPANDSFTRFTSTAPSFSSSQFQSQASSSSQQQPSSSSSSSSPSPPINSPRETPHERVARLRAEHAAKRAAEFSHADRMISAGRRAADVAHRATTYSLLGFSAVATVIAAYGIVSLVSHNRTQKRAWIEREMGRLDDARAAFLAGKADAEQLHLLEQERAGEELHKRYEEEKRQKRWFGNFRDKFAAAFGAESVEGKGDSGSYGDRVAVDNVQQNQMLQQQQQQQQQTQQTQTQQQTPKRFRMGDAEIELRPAAVQESRVPGVGLDEKGRPVPMSKMEQVRVQPPSTSKARQLEDSTILATVGSNRRGGPLDQWAQNATDSASDAGSSFWSSIFGGSGSGRSNPTTSS